MTSLLGWIKNHKLVILLLLIIFFLSYKRYSPYSLSESTNFNVGSQDFAGSAKMMAGTASISPLRDAAPAPEVASRLIIKESNLSLLVSKVTDAQEKIIQKANELGGYMVNSSISNPQDVASSTVIVRIPTKTLDKALEYYRSLAVKVISENLQGNDVTDQYTDLEAQLETLNKTKFKFEQILEKATVVADILNVQRELINIQAQIDSIKGQQQYYEKSAEMSKIILYLSTDELSLPYAPTDTWRPQVIFKEAVRSLIQSLRSLGSSIIWIAVYAVVWIPILIIVYFVNKKYSKKI